MLAKTKSRKKSKYKDFRLLPFLKSRQKVIVSAMKKEPIVEKTTKHTIYFMSLYINENYRYSSRPLAKVTFAIRSVVRRSYAWDSPSPTTPWATIFWLVTMIPIYFLSRLYPHKSFWLGNSTNGEYLLFLKRY